MARFISEYAASTILAPMVLDWLFNWKAEAQEGQT